MTSSDMLQSSPTRTCLKNRNSIPRALGWIRGLARCFCGEEDQCLRNVEEIIQADE